MLLFMLFKGETFANIYNEGKSSAKKSINFIPYVYNLLLTRIKFILVYCQKQNNKEACTDQDSSPYPKHHGVIK